MSSEAKKRVADRLFKMKHQLSSSNTDSPANVHLILQKHAFHFTLMLAVAILCIVLIYQQHQIPDDPKHPSIKQSRWTTYILTFVLFVCMIIILSIILS